VAVTRTGLVVRVAAGAVSTARMGVGHGYAAQGQKCNQNHLFHCFLSLISRGKMPPDQSLSFAFFQFKYVRKIIASSIGSWFDKNDF
jgi:hypothetical protein